MTCSPPSRLCKNDCACPQYRVHAYNHTLATHQRPEVGVRTERGFLLRHPVRARRVLDAPSLAPARLLAEVLPLKRARREPESLAKDCEKGVVHRQRLLYERPDGGLHPRVHGARVVAVHLAWPRECIVFGDVDELDGVERALLICRIRTRGFVSAGVELDRIFRR